MKSGWKSWFRMAAAMLALAGGLWAQGAGAAEVKNVTAAFLWPWTNAVGISFEAEGTLPTNAGLVVTATDRTKNVTYYAATNMLSGDTGTAAGKHQVVWDLGKQGVSIQSTNVVFSVTYTTNRLYCVVNLSGGTNALSYPVTYMDAPSSSWFNTSAYKTTMLVLRRIDAGTFNMNGSYPVTLTKPFYIGLFEVTQKQWELVTGGNRSAHTGDMRPVDQVSYDEIRGSSVGTNWPAGNAVDASSFVGKLRAKTGLEFDLPTEAQWEYACRAGTTSSYNNGGSTTNDLNKLGRYLGNGGYANKHAAVGSYQPNAWGLYDMHGNVWEWCLDWYGSLAAGTDPKGPSSGSARVRRGGGWRYDDYACTSSFRNFWYMSMSAGSVGFRLVRTLSAE